MELKSIHTNVVNYTIYRLKGNEDDDIVGLEYDNLFDDAEIEIYNEFDRKYQSYNELKCKTRAIIELYNKYENVYDYYDFNLNSFIVVNNEKELGRYLYKYIKKELFTFKYQENFYFYYNDLITIIDHKIRYVDIISDIPFHLELFDLDSNILFYNIIDKKVVDYTIDEYIEKLNRKNKYYIINYGNRFHKYLIKNNKLLYDKKSSSILKLNVDGKVFILYDKEDDFFTIYDNCFYQIPLQDKTKFNTIDFNGFETYKINSYLIISYYASLIDDENYSENKIFLDNYQPLYYIYDENKVFNTYDMNGNFIEDFSSYTDVDKLLNDLQEHTDLMKAFKILNK